jgi:cation diffusion facilitator family transporter
MPGPDDGHHHPHGHEHFGPADAATIATRRGVRATWISLGALLATALLQLLIVGATDSVALLADTIHNFTDALTAIPLLIAFRLARRPPTKRYSYGYHRAEDLAGVVIVAVILVSAVVAAIEAVQRLIHPQPVEHVGWLLIAGVIGAIGNEAVALYRIRVGRSIGSAAMEADGLHARTDGLTSLAVVGSALAVLAGFPRADPLIGLAITVVIFWTMIQAARAVIHRVLDGTDAQTITLIQEVAASVLGVEHVGDTRARWTGHQLLTELSIDVDPGLSVLEGHEVAERVRGALLEHVPRLADASVHVDPHEHESHTA